MDNENIYNQLIEKFSAEAMIGPDAENELQKTLIKHCFTPEEAEVAARLPFYYSPWPIEKVSKASGKPVSEIEPLLASMVNKGVIRGRSKTYALLPILPGMFENVLMDDDESEWHREFARIASELYETGYVRNYLEQPTHVARSIPVGISYNTKSQAIDPDHIEMMIRSHDTMIVLNNCQCRQAKYLIGDECGRAERTDGCIGFGDFANHFIERGAGRALDKDSMRSVIKDRIDKKLTFFTGNVAAASANLMCTCCECCCHMLGQILSVDPNLIITPPRYKAVVNEEKCNNCVKCLSACNIRAHNMAGSSHTYDQTRCIGCGLCIGVCPTAAIELVENKKFRKPSKSFKRLAIRLAPSKIMAMIKGKMAM